MNFWLVKRALGDVGAGEVSAVALIAGTQSDARRVCAEICGAEGPAVWLDPKRSTAILINPNGHERVILRAFNQG